MKRTFILIAVVMTMLATYAQQARTHVVSQGETIATIAQMYGITPEKLVEANPGLANGFFAGVKLTIPAMVANTQQADKFIHKVQPGETVSTIAKDYGVDAQKILAANPELNQRFYAGMEIEIPLGQAAAQPKQPVAAPMPTPQVSSAYNAPKQEYSQQTNPQSGTPVQKSVTAEDFSHWFLSYCAPFEGLDHGMYGLGWTEYLGSAGFGATLSANTDAGIASGGSASILFKLGPIYGKPISDNVLLGAKLLANIGSTQVSDDVTGGVTILPHIAFRADRFILTIGVEVGWFNGYDDVYNAAHITIGYKF